MTTPFQAVPKLDIVELYLHSLHTLMTVLSYLNAGTCVPIPQFSTMSKFERFTAQV
jgi:hypothetical protein